MRASAPKLPVRRASGGWRSAGADRRALTVCWRELRRSGWWLCAVAPTALDRFDETLRAAPVELLSQGERLPLELVATAVDHGHLRDPKYTVVESLGVPLGPARRRQRSTTRVPVYALPRTARAARRAPRAAARRRRTSPVRGASRPSLMRRAPRTGADQCRGTRHSRGGRSPRRSLHEPDAPS